MITARMSLVFFYSSVNHHNLVEWFSCKIWQKRSIHFLLSTRASNQKATLLRRYCALSRMLSLHQCKVKTESSPDILKVAAQLQGSHVW